jgi:hypothetical protein
MHMATPNKTAPKLPQKPVAHVATPTAKTNGAEPATETKLSKRVTFWSAVVPTFSVRVLRSLAESNEVPYHGGQPMVRRSGRPAGGGGKVAKEAREKMLAGMTEEQKLAFITKEKEEKKAKKTARKEAERAALKEQLRKELEAELGKK